MDPKQHEIGSPDMAKFRRMVALLQAGKKMVMILYGNMHIYIYNPAGIR